MKQKQNNPNPDNKGNMLYLFYIIYISQFIPREIQSDLQKN